MDVQKSHLDHLVRPAGGGYSRLNASWLERGTDNPQGTVFAVSTYNRPDDWVYASPAKRGTDPANNAQTQNLNFDGQLAVSQHYPQLKVF
jgi:hypothetical protein